MKARVAWEVVCRVWQASLRRRTTQGTRVANLPEGTDGNVGERREYDSDRVSVLVSKICGGPIADID